ncbi:MAG: hypothetical protein NTW21_42280 [Verrucomicrobia bacterium]|nr:hypothetical protein [Verrucomicrobiota bacterium]
MRRLFQIRLGCTAALLSAVLASAPVAQAEVLNVNFAGGDGAATYSGQGHGPTPAMTPGIISRSLPVRTDAGGISAG